MSEIYDDSSLEETTDSFWEVGNYKRTVKRIDDGNRLCNDLMNCIQERAKIEKAYAQQLTEWSKRWRQLVDRGPQYGTVERAWMALMTEADKMMGGFKETKEAEEGFKKAQKPWAKKLKELEAAKKSYHMTCKEERLAVTREANSRAEASVPAEQQKKLQEKLDKCKQDSQKAREKYEKALEELSNSTPQYTESMEQVFEQCQQFEERRLSFIKEVLLDVKRHLNLTENQSYAAVYRDLEQTISSASPQEDLRWFSSSHGPGMHMHWPQFEEYNPDLAHSIAKKEKLGKGDKIKLTHVTPSVQHSQGGDRGSVSSYEKNQAYTPSTEWSDEDQMAPNSGSDTNGGSNPFEEDVGRGVRVRALYDYEGQEQDELTFKAGEELTKLEDEDEQGWCKGRLDNGKLGLYPANYVEAI
uniref:Protein kinase C and casein kinase substrate in neurons 1b n=1 Tax=Oryzias sinensis TaxID=183150 RepID=A0A8C7YK04_9TELE